MGVRRPQTVFKNVPLLTRLLRSAVPDAAAGGSDDWAKGVAGIPLSYTIELPGGNGHGFDLPPSYIPSVGRHQMQLIDVFASHVAQLGKDKKSA